MAALFVYRLPSWNMSLIHLNIFNSSQDKHTTPILFQNVNILLVVLAIIIELLSHATFN